ncbi:MAG: type IV toxin-antitoxin system AbiEi family antitoxin domain-containing protein [Alcanivorax sediminis]|uniref:type IV toxin-antitoxin system AbiEi family antitoxin domain-containing protein n=1 Tax=Alcanivorax sediminis TaxID=2663008 RepID=UPI003C5CB57B
MINTRQHILDIARSQGVVRSRDITAQGLPRIALTRLVREGLLIRIDRGLYSLPDRPPSEHGSLAEVASKFPEGIVCLLSALRVHNLTTQAPFEVWLAIPHKSRAPAISYPPRRIVRFSGKALSAGVEEIQIEGISIKITSIARTVVDCFRFRNKIGLDVALEALREAIDSRRVSMDELWRMASQLRATNTMRPYLESLA